MAAFLDPGAWGREFTSAIDGYENMAGMWIVGEDMPQETNRITVNVDDVDQFGLPTPNVHFDDHPNDVAMRNHAYGRASAIYKAVGATAGLSRRHPIPRRTTWAPTGCARTPRDGVVNRWGQTHDIPNLFVSDGIAVHDRGRREPDAHHRGAGDPSGRPYRPRDGGGHNLNRPA